MTDEPGLRAKGHESEWWSGCADHVHPDRTCGYCSSKFHRLCAALAATPAASDECGTCPHPAHVGWCPARPHGDPCSCRTPAASDGSLDVAWTAAEAAMPDGWRIRSLILMGRRWEAVAAEGGRGSGREIYIAHGPTPTAALRALAARLSESPSEGKTE